MKTLFGKISRAFQVLGMSERDRYLMQAVDLADLERRRKRWDELQSERLHFYRNGGWY